MAGEGRPPTAFLRSISKVVGGRPSPAMTRESGHDAASFFSRGRSRSRSGPACRRQDGAQRIDQRRHHGVGVQRRWREAQALLAARHRGIVDRRGIHAELAQQPLADFLAQSHLTYVQRHDVAGEDAGAPDPPAHTGTPLPRWPDR